MNIYFEQNIEPYITQSALHAGISNASITKYKGLGKYPSLSIAIVTITKITLCSLSITFY